MIPYAEAMAMQFAVRESAYDASAAQLYALGVGVGLDAADDHALRFLYEQSMQALPSLATVVAWEDSWLERIALDLTKVVHGEQRITLHRPLPVAGRLRSHFRLRDIFDKGTGKGAIVLAEMQLFEAGSDAPLATLLSSVFARGDGGFGGEPGPVPPMRAVPERAPDATLHSPTMPNQAALYRLSGDRNPLHIDPDFAGKAGFPKPILHGLCVFGAANYALIRLAAGGDAARLEHFEARFSSPFYPGESLLTEIWRMGDNDIAFRCLAAERGVVVLDRGSARLRN